MKRHKRRFRERAGRRPKPGEVGVRMGSMGPVGLRAAYSIGVNTSGAHVDEDTSLTLPAVYAAVSTIAKDLSTLPLVLKRRRPDGYLEDAKEHPAYKLFARTPDGGNTTPSAWRVTLMLHMLVWGNGYAEVIRDLAGNVIALELRDPVEVAPYLDGTTLWYKHLGTDIAREKIVHVRTLSREGISGYSAVLLARQALGLGLTGERFAGQYLSKGLQSSGFIHTPAEMTPEARQQLAKDIQQAASGDGAFGLVVMPPGCRFESISTDPDKAQLLESRRYQVLEVARLFGVPPHKLMSFEHAAYSTIEASNLEYAQGTLGPLATLVEEALNLRVLTEQEHLDGYQFKHDFRAMTRGDSAARAAYWKAMHSIGVACSNDVAIAEGFEPHPGGNIHWRPLNMTGDNHAEAAHGDAGN